jgi:hypothetical protein
MRLFRRRAGESDAMSELRQGQQWQRNPLVGPDPVIDLNAAVHNPELDRTVAGWLADGEDTEARKDMKLALARAVYLTPVRFAGGEHAGARIAYADRTTFGFLRCPMPALDDATGIGVCTNEYAYDRCAPEGSTTQLMRAVDLYVLALQSADCAGLLINPGDGQHALPLYRPWCEEIRYLLGKGPHPFPAVNEGLAE